MSSNTEETSNNNRILIIVAIVVTLISGAFASVSNKALYDLKTDGLDNCDKENPHPFNKAYITTVFMFIGEAMCLAYYFAEKWYRRRVAKSGSAQLKEVDPVETSEPTGTKPPLWNYLVLSCFDLSATAISGVGLKWVSASATLMLRGSGVLFTALFSMCVLRRRLSSREWFGILIVCGGLAAVGGSAAYHAKLQEQAGKDNDDAVDATPFQAAIGVILILAGSALNSIQGVAEEKLLKVTGDAEIHPLEVVGWEGVFGFFSSSFILLPIMHAIPGDDCGSQENSLDSLRQMHNSYIVVLLLVGYAFSLALMNYYSQVISKYLSAVHRNLISTLRTILVWVVSIILYYALTHGNFGEQWDNSSYVQLAGFVLLVIGTIIYGLKPPVDHPQGTVTDNQELSAPLMDTDAGTSDHDYNSHPHTQPIHYQHRVEVD